MGHILINTDNGTAVGSVFNYDYEAPVDASNGKHIKIFELVEVQS